MDETNLDAALAQIERKRNVDRAFITLLTDEQLKLGMVRVSQAEPRPTGDKIVDSLVPADTSLIEEELIRRARLKTRPVAY